MNLDPENIDSRLYKQVSKLLEQLETKSTVTLRERVQALVAIARIQTIFMSLRQKGSQDDNTAGSSVRKYESAFQAHDARRRKAIARATAEADDDDGDDLLGDDDEGRDSA
jgi:hypothetical protein